MTAYALGMRIKFEEEKRSYVIRACSKRYLVCTKPFNARSTTIYTVVDLEQQIRGTEGVLGPGWETDEDCAESLERLMSGETQVSRRNRIDLKIERVMPARRGEAPLRRIICVGYNISCFAEKKTESGYEPLDFKPFDWRNGDMYSFFAGVKSRSTLPPLTGPRGLPEDVSPQVAQEREDDAPILRCFFDSWLSLAELTGFDYEQTFEDSHDADGRPCELGEGEIITYRTALGEPYFRDLQQLQQLGADRIVFWFS